MAFYGCEFIFDGLSCTEFGLSVYSFDSNGQEDVDFSSGDIVEDRISRRYDSLMYGVTQNSPLEFKLVFGASPRSLDANSHIERYEVEAIAAWLTGHNNYKWLSIVQDDMTQYRYKVIISDLTLITYGDLPWAFSCKVRCDSPFGYTYPEEYEYIVTESSEITLFNRSSYNGFYYPVVEIERLTTAGGISITNKSDNNRMFEFKSDLPTADGLVINVDNKNQIITSWKSSEGIKTGMDLYNYFNFKFFRMVRGENHLTIQGNAKVKFICDFPVNIGG